MLYVPGNHEYDGLEFATAQARLRQTCADLGIEWLDREQIVIGDVRFIGTTLWADFDALAAREATVTKQLAAREKAFRAANFYLRRYSTLVDGQHLLAEGQRELALDCQAWLRAALAVPFDGKTVAVTPGDSMSQIWPLFLKKTGLKESDFKTVSGDAQTKLNAVINNQADLLLGYVMDQAIKLQDAVHKPVYPIRFADFGVNMVSSGFIVQKDYLKEKPDVVKRFLRAATKSLEEAAKNPEAAVDAMLAAKPKSGVKETALVGMKNTAALYKGPDNPKDRPLRVGRKNMDETLALLVEYGGLDKASAGKAGDYYTNEYLP